MAYKKNYSSLPD